MVRLEEAFLSDILEHPDDDAPRLVFADWLEDNGNPSRADFIRVQCELAQIPNDERRLLGLKQREADLLRRHQQCWTAPVAECRVSWPVFRRGFIEAVDVSAAVFVEGSSRLFALAPIREVTLHDAVGRLTELARCPWLARLSLLRLAGSEAELVGGTGRLRAFGALCGSPHLHHLRGLDLTGCGIGTSGAVVLALSRSLPALAELGLGENDLGDDAVAALAGLDHRGGLEVLDLSNNAVTDHGAQLLARSTTLGRLRWLRLDGNPIGNEGVEALLRSSTLTSLAHLACDEGGLRLRCQEPTACSLHRGGVDASGRLRLAAFRRNARASRKRRPTRFCEPRLNGGRHLPLRFLVFAAVQPPAAHARRIVQQRDDQAHDFRTMHPLIMVRRAGDRPRRRMRVVDGQQLEPAVAHVLVGEEQGAACRRRSEPDWPGRWAEGTSARLAPCHPE